MKIIVDARGCDNPLDVARGVALASNETNANLVVYGDKNILLQLATEENCDLSKLEIVDAPEEITNFDSPVRAIVSKKNSSLVLALKRLLADDDCAALISAGNTGAVLCGATMILGKKEGIERPTLTTILPAKNDKWVCITDCGANIDCRAEQLAKFAEVASEYMAKTYKVEPKVATLSIGSEDKKGNELSKATFALLKESNLNFVGNVEANSVLNGDVDVVVCDGFVGNALLKNIEGTAKFVAEAYTKTLMANLPKDIDGSFIKKSLKQLMVNLDFTSMGGAVLLGTNKLVVKAHGAANSMTIVSCVKQALQALE